MSDPFVGEVRRFPTNAIPDGWLPCDGRLVPVAQQPALGTLLGPVYGGDGQNTFALPDLRGRTAVGQGGSAGPMGASGSADGPATSYLALVYAIAVVGMFPPRQ
jgi:microcystin-dependent protein